MLFMLICIKLLDFRIKLLVFRIKILTTYYIDYQFKNIISEIY